MWEERIKSGISSRRLSEIQYTINNFVLKQAIVDTGNPYAGRIFLLNISDFFPQTFQQPCYVRLKL